MNKYGVSLGDLLEPTHGDEIVYLASDVDARIAELEKALRDAIEDISSWGDYASEYFQEKHDLAGCLDKHIKTLGLMDRGSHD